MEDVVIPRPHRSRCSPERDDYNAIILAHEEAVRNGEASYRDPGTGLVVLTVTTHLDRGSCCESGCRHCPYIRD